MFKGKACGKFILLGEHFVVRHDEQETAVPALAFPLEQVWCEVRVKPNSHPHYSAEFPGVDDRGRVESLMARAVYAAADSFRVDVSSQPLDVHSKANFPISRGFGSSAAFAVALSRAFDEYRKSVGHPSADWQELVKASSAIERIFHGQPSGVDTAVILSKSAIRFENGAIVREIVNKAVDFVAVDSGTRDQCANLVGQVLEFRKRNGEQWNRMCKLKKALVDDCEKALANGDAQMVARTVKEAHGVLSELGLSHPTIDAILAEAPRWGALGGKVSGAGGGGAVLLIANKGDGKRLAQCLQDTGRSVVAVEQAI